MRGLAAVVLGAALFGAGYWLGDTQAREKSGPATLLDAPGEMEPARPSRAGDDTPLAGDAGPAALVGQGADLGPIRRALASVPWPDMPPRSGVVSFVVETEDGKPVPEVACTTSLKERPEALTRLYQELQERGPALDEALTLRATIQSTRWQRAMQTKARTDATGRCKTEGLLEGAYQVRAYSEVWDLERQGGGDPVMSGAEVHFVARAKVGVTVELTLAGGKAPPKASLSFRSQRRHAQRPWRADRTFVPSEPGTFQVTATWTDPESGRTYASEETTCDVRGDGTTETLRLELVERTVLTGDVLFADGEAALGARVTVGRLVDGAAVSPQEIHVPVPPRLRRGGIRASKARYRSTPLTPGAYVVELHRGRSGRPLVREEIQVVAGLNTLDLAMPELSDQESIEVEVLSPSGEPVEGASFRSGAFGESGSSLGGFSALSLGKGIYRGLFMADQPKSATHWVAAESAKWGTTFATFRPPHQGRLVLRFAAPLRVQVRVKGADDERYDERLNVHLSATPSAAARAMMHGAEVKLAGDRVATFERMQPGRAVLLVSLRDLRHGAEIFRKAVELSPGTEMLVADVGELHTLKVVGPAGRASLFGRTAGGGHVHRSITLSDAPSVIDGLVAGTYTVSKGTVRIQVKIPEMGSVDLGE